MSDKVVSLRDGVVPQGQPNQKVIDMLEAALDQAREGRIQACGIALVFANDCISANCQYPDGKRWAMAAATRLLDAEFMHRLVIDDGER